MFAGNKELHIPKFISKHSMTPKQSEIMSPKVMAQIELWTIGMSQTFRDNFVKSHGWDMFGTSL